MSIERFLLANFAADFLLLAVSVRAVGQVKLGRVALAALWGTAYALAACGRWSWLRGGAGLAGCLAVMSLVACPPGSLVKRARLCVSLIVCSGLAGGLQAALGARSVPLFFAALVTYALFSDSRRAAREERTVRLRLYLGGGCVELNALVDSGNRLHEPLSGLPVLVVRKECLEQALGRERLEALAGRARPVRFRSLSGGGELLCLRAQRLQILRRGRAIPAGDVFVALCGHTLSGEHQAIAPVGIFVEA